ncbi:MAG: oligosaccharide flippase family protein [Desulfobacula sp.]|nr:oligosaccharide flippase family protein [Desulfobacula sp.]
MAGYIKNSLNLISGNLVAQGISLLTMPLVTRLYSPAEFGIFSVFLSCVVILAPLSTMRFEEVIILPRKLADACNVFIISWVSSIIFSLIILIVILVMIVIPGFEHFFSIKKYQNYLLLLPLAVFFRGTLLSLNALAIRQARFKSLSIVSVLTAASNRVTVISLGILTALGSWGLIFGRIAGAISAITFLFFLDIKKLIPEFKKNVSRPEIKKLIIKYKDFTKYGIWSNLLHTSAREIIVILLISLFSPTIAGTYAFCRNVILNPLNIISSAVNKVFRQRAAMLKDSRIELQKEILQFVNYLCYLILPIIIILLFLGDSLFNILFGQEWHEAGRYIQILAPSFFFIFLYSSLRSIFIIIERPKDRLFFDIFYFSLRGGSLLIAAAFNSSAILALAIMSLITCFLIYFFFLYICQLLKLNKYNFIIIISKKILIMIPLISGLFIIKFYFISSMVIALILLGLSILIQFLTVLFFEPPLIRAIKDYLQVAPKKI